MNLLPFAVRCQLEKATYSRNYTDIMNDHPVLADAVPTLEAAAALVGIEFSETGHTFTVAKPKEGKDRPTIYMPSIRRNADGIPVLSWGKVQKPLADILKTVNVGIDDVDGDFYAEFSPFPSDDDGDDAEAFYFSVPINVERDDQGAAVCTASDLRKALGTKKFAGYLREIKASNFVKLRDVAPGTYQVTGYTTGLSFGKEVYYLDVVDVGSVKANTELTKAIDSGLVVSPDQPASLTIGEVTKYTKQGHPIVPTTLIPFEVLDAEIFCF